MAQSYYVTVQEYHLEEHQIDITVMTVISYITSIENGILHNTNKNLFLLSIQQG